jgi:hypothetical protein
MAQRFLASMLGTVANDHTGINLRAGGTALQGDHAELFGNVGSGGRLAISTQPNVDLTLATTSRTGFVNACAAALTAGCDLYIDQPIYLACGNDPTTPIFLPSNLNIAFGPKGLFIVDHLTVCPFILANTQDCIYNDWRVLYIGNFGQNCIDQNFGPMFTVPGIVHNVTLTNYYQALYASSGGVHGVNLTGGQTAAWWGPSAYTNLFCFRGACQRLTFNRLKVFVPQGASCASFVPVVCGFYPDFIEGTTVTGNPALSQSNCASPSQIKFIDPEFDGYMMGWVEYGDVYIENPILRRYTDVQDGTTGTVTFSAGLASGVSTGTLAANWPASPGTGTYELLLNNVTLATSALTASGATLPFTSTTGVALGMYATGTNIPPNAYVLSFVVNTSVTLSANIQASVANGASIQFGQSIYTVLTAGSTTMGTFQYPMRFNSAYASGTSMTLTGWILGNGSWTVTFSSGDIKTVTVAGTAATWSGALSANATSAAATILTTTTTTATAGSGNVGGVGNWSAPPHGFYMNSGGLTWNYRLVVKGGVDYGNFVGLPTRRATGSGSTICFKWEPGNYSEINGFTSYRPDGFIDIQSFGDPRGGKLLNCSGCVDSSLSTLDGGIIWGIRAPGPSPLINFVSDNVTMTDLAAVSAQFPITQMVGANSGCSITNWRVYVNDFNNSGYLCIPFAGDSLRVTAEYHAQLDNSTTTFRGLVDNTGVLTNSDMDIVVFGHRKWSVTFSAALLINATSATLLSNWLFDTGPYLVTFPSGEQRVLTLTLNSTTVAAFTALTSAEPALGAYANGALINNYGNWKSRWIGMQSGKSYNNRVRVRDVFNGWEGLLIGNTPTETITEQVLFTPTAAASFYDIPLTKFQSTMSVLSYSWTIVGNLGTANGLTLVNLGWSGFPTQIAAGLNITTATNVNRQPLTAPIPMTGTLALRATCAAGTFDGTGQVCLSVTAQQIGVNG